MTDTTSRASLTKSTMKTNSRPRNSSAGSNSRVKTLMTLFLRDPSASTKSSVEMIYPLPSPSLGSPSLGSPALSSPALSSPILSSTASSPLSDGIIPLCSEPRTPIILDHPGPLVSIWESDTEDEEEPSFREKIRAQVGKKGKEKERKKEGKIKRQNSTTSSTESESVPESQSTPESDYMPELEKLLETHSQRESHKPTLLQIVPGTPIPSRVFGRNIPYDIRPNSQSDPEPTRTFRHFKQLPNHYSPPTGNEVLHVRENGYEYLTLEKANGATRIIAGTLQCLVAELAYPLFAENDPDMLFGNMLFCGSMLFGNVNLLEMLFQQIKNCTGKFEDQVNIVNFLMHWLRAKPEDFSWCEEILEVRNQIFRYILATSRQTELATALWSLSVKHEKLEHSYMRFAEKQKKGWVSFEDVLMAYTHDTDCTLVEGGLCNIDADDLTFYMAATDLVLFRDGSEMSTLDHYWKETKCQDSGIYHVGEPEKVPKPPWWDPADRAKRLLLRIKMIKHWVSLEILQIEKMNERALMIKTFVEVAGNLWEMGDFHGCHCIMQGLDSPLVRCLTRTWEEVGDYSHARFQQLREFLNDRTVYDKDLMKPSQDPVIPYYKYFLEEVTQLYNEKDHSSRLKNTNTNKTHRDLFLNEFGVWDTNEGKALRPVSKDGRSQLSTSVDLKKYRSLLEAVDGHRKRAKPDYWFAGEITREAFVMRLYLIGMNSFSTLQDLENSAATGRKGRLNYTSRLVETRVLEAWVLVPHTNTPAIFFSEEIFRSSVLQGLLMATGE